MENRPYSREELVSIILDNDKSLDEYDDDDITELVPETKVTRNINDAHDKKLTRGDVMADKLASFAGSWVFISAFASYWRRGSASTCCWEAGRTIPIRLSF